MKNYSKFLCVVLALIVALSAASCSLGKQYSYKTDDVELPIGVYIQYLRSAYFEAQSFAQKSDKYDSEAGTYDGNKSFLALEITDDDGNTAVAEEWIKNRADEMMNEACAVYSEYNKLGATIDEANLAEYRSSYKDAWDNGYDYYGYQQPALSETYEPLGIGFESFFLTGVTISLMREAVFEKEYAVDGPKAVSDDELHKFFEDTYTSYHYFSANLYTSIEKPTTDENGNETTETVNNPMTEADVKKYTDAFDGYAAEINGGAKFSDILSKYNEAFSASATATERITEMDADTEDELQKAIIALKEGEAKQIIIGSDESSRQIYLIYKEPIADTTATYFENQDNRSAVLNNMKEDDFTELLKEIAKGISIDKSSACNNYKPSMFES